jgi:hypothetical protein
MISRSHVATPARIVTISFDVGFRMVQPHAPIDSISSPTPRFVRSPRSPAVRRRYSRNGPSCQLRFIVPISRWNLPLANGGTASKYLHSCAGLRMPISTKGDHNERSCVDRRCRDGGWVGAFHCPCDGHAGQFPPQEHRRFSCSLHGTAKRSIGSGSSELLSRLCRGCR